MTRILLRTSDPVGQNYAEATFFDGAHYSHIAAWQENLRLERIRKRVSQERAMIERWRRSRGIQP